MGFISTFSFCGYTCALGADACFRIFVRLCDNLFTATQLYSAVNLTGIGFSLFCPSAFSATLSFCKKNIGSGRRLAFVLLLGWWTFKSHHLILIELRFCFDVHWDVAKTGRAYIRYLAFVNILNICKTEPGNLYWTLALYLTWVLLQVRPDVVSMGILSLSTSSGQDKHRWAFAC